MIKAELIELVQGALAGGEAPASIRRKYHQADIELFLETAFNDIFQEEFDRNRTDFTVFDNYAKAYKCTVKNDESRGERYIDLPVSVIPLRPKQAGIRAISPYKGQQLAFAPVQSTSAPIWNELEAVRVDPTCGYYLEDGKIFFEPYNPPNTGDILMARIITPFSELSDDDTVFVPGGRNIIIFEKVYQILLQRGNKADDQNNNNTTQMQ